MLTKVHMQQLHDKIPSNIIGKINNRYMYLEICTH